MKLHISERAAQFHRSRAKVEIALANRAKDWRARAAHFALAERHRARSAFIKAVLMAGSPIASHAFKADKEA